MTFIWPWMLASLVIVPVFIAWYIRLYASRKQDTADLGPMSYLQDQAGRPPGRRRHTPVIFFLLGLALLLFSLSRPEVTVALPRIEGTVILAFDVSRSMAAEDLEPTRMDAAKAAAKVFVENQPETIRIGVVAFSNGGLVVQPPTDDQTLILNTIDRLAPQGSTSLGQGIFSSLNAITGEPIAVDPQSFDEGEPPSIDLGNYPSAVILLLTDGENTSAPDPLQIAQIAAEASIRIYPVGIGSKEGTVLEVDGYNVLTQLNEVTLEQIAELTNGAYYHAESEEDLQEIYKNVDLQLQIRGEKMEATALIAGISLIFFLIGAAFSLLWFGRMPL